MGNFDIKKFLTENKLTEVSRRMNEPEPKVRPDCKTIRNWAHQEYESGYDLNDGIEGTQPINWDVDDFVSWVDNNMTGQYELGSYIARKVTGIPENTNIIDYLNDGGSGLNNNEEFNKYGSWRAALYDIWKEIQRNCL